MKKKYEILKTNTYNMNGKTLYRIIAIRNFGDIKKGEIGGFVESERNLSHNGNCWIHDDAKVYEKAKVYGDAQIYDHSMVYGKAKVYGHAKLFKSSLVTENAKIYGSSCLTGFTAIRHKVRIYGNAKIADAMISDKTKVYGNVIVDTGGVIIQGNSKIYGSSYIRGNTKIIDCYIHGCSEINNVRCIKQSNISGVTKLEYNDKRIKNMNIIDNKVYRKNADGGFGYI